MFSGNETGLILPVGNPDVKTIMLLRKMTPLSIAEIKQRAIEGKLITGFANTDKYGTEDEEVLLHSVKKARKKLLKLGVDARMVVDGEVMGSEKVNNHIQMLREIAAELEWEDEVGFAQEEVGRAIAELSCEYDDFNWWVQEDMTTFSEELDRELHADHPLAGRNLVPVARNDRNDDVLFHDGGRFICVHLTWNTSNTLPFPRFDIVDDENIADFLKRDYLEDGE